MVGGSQRWASEPLPLVPETEMAPIMFSVNLRRKDSLYTSCISSEPTITPSLPHNFLSFTPQLTHLPSKTPFPPYLQLFYNYRELSFPPFHSYSTLTKSHQRLSSLPFYN